MYARGGVLLFADNVKTKKETLDTFSRKVREMKDAGMNDQTGMGGELLYGEAKRELEEKMKLHEQLFLKIEWAKSGWARTQKILGVTVLNSAEVPSEPGAAQTALKAHVY